MINQLFTTKGQMGQLFAPERQTVTWLLLPKQTVSQLKATDKNGYLSLKVAIGQKSKDRPRWIREVRLQEETELKLGDALPIDQIIAEGDTIKATSTSKGKGFAGVMKRHNFHGGPRTHGQSDRARAPGSIGRGTTPGRVVKGKKMAGHMGNATVTVSNLKVLKLDLENNQLAVSGPVPGATGSLVRLTIIKKHA